MSILNFQQNYLYGRNGPPFTDYNPFVPQYRPNMLLGGLFGLLNIFTIGLMSRIAMRSNNSFLNRMYPSSNYHAGGTIWGYPNYDTDIGLDTFNPTFIQNARYSFPNTGNFLIPEYNPALNRVIGWNNIDYKPTISISKVQNTGVKDDTQVKDGTPITLSDVNYDIMGDSAETVKKLRPEMQRKVEKLFEYANKRGWKLTINGEDSGFRTQQQQNKLIAEGKPAAKGDKSRHLKGCAVDIKINGSHNTNLLNTLGQYAKQIGMRWGGDFTNPTREKWHFDIDPDKTPKGTVGDNISEA